MTARFAILRRRVMFLSIFGISAVLLGCAGGTPPMDAISTAETAVNEATDAKAAEYAPLELRLATEKLQRARMALEQEDYEQARRLAEAARVDARLAEAKARSESTRQQAQEVQQTIETLEREVDQTTTGQ